MQIEEFVAINRRTRVGYCIVWFSPPDAQFVATGGRVWASRSEFGLLLHPQPEFLSSVLFHPAVNN